MEPLRETLAYLLGRRAFEERHHRRYQFAASLLLRLLASAAALSYAMAGSGAQFWVRMATLGWVPFWLFTPEIMALGHGLFSTLRHHALADVQGQYYVFRGQPIRVAEWVPGERWLAVEDLERALQMPLGRHYLRHAQQQELCVQRDGRSWLSAPAVLAYLQGRGEPRALKLRQWVHGTVWLPSAQARRLGRDRWQR